MKSTWIDTHIHLSDIGPGGRQRHGFLAALECLLDSCDADLRLIASCDSPYMGRMRDDPDAILPGNQFIHDVCRHFPGRIFGACTMNPLWPKASAQAIDRCFGDWGFVMLGEMLPYCHHYVMDCEDTALLVRQATGYGVPTQVHLGTYCRPDRGYVPGDSMDGIGQLADLMGCVRRVPEAWWVLAHAIGRAPDPTFIPWADMFLDAIFGVYGRFPDNFWIEIRDFYAQALPRVLREVPINRLLAGTDWTTRHGPPFAPYGTCFEAQPGNNPFPPAVASLLGFLRAAGANDDTIQAIACHNAKDLFRLPI